LVFLKEVFLLEGGASDVRPLLASAARHREVVVADVVPTNAATQESGRIERRRRNGNDHFVLSHDSSSDHVDAFFSEQFVFSQVLEVEFLIPGWGLVNTVVVGDKDLLVLLQVCLGHDGHDSAEAGMTEFSESGIRFERVTSLVTGRGAVLVETDVGIRDVEANVTRSDPDPVIGELVHLLHHSGLALPDSVEQSHQGSGRKKPFCVEPFSGKLNL
jgi:hypothetical protein